MGNSSRGSIQIEIENLGGINSLTTAIPPGINILSGKNATNRTSFLRSVAAALGADQSAGTLKTDSTEGYVSLSFDGESVSRNYERTNGSVIRTGDPLTDKSELVDNYVSLFSTNPARTAIRSGGTGLRDILMSGVDTAEIKSEIQSLKQRRTSLQSQLDEIERAQAQLPAKESRQQSLESELHEIEQTIEEVEQNIEEYKATADEIDAAEEVLDALEDRREDLRRVENRIEATEQNLSQLKQERQSIEADLEEITVSDKRRSELQTKREALDSEISELQSTVTDLSDIISHNRSVLEDDEVVHSFETDETVVSQIDPSGSTVECWTCGSEVERSTIESRMETLEDIRKQTHQQLQKRRQELESVTSELSSIKENERERYQLEDELRDTNSAIDAETESLADLNARAENLREEVEDLQEQVANTEELRESELPDAYQRLNQLQHERGQKEAQLEQVEETIEDLEATIADKDDVERQLRQVKKDLDETRGQIKQIEQNLVDQFNGQMEDLIDILGYENISRVWLERIVENGPEAAEFAIHVVREAEDGSVYEDSLSTLSESEREIIGIMISVSGYFVHGLDKEIPLMLFDSVEVIDATRLEALLEYISEYAPYLIVALLPEEAAAIEKRTITAPSFEVQS
ncbi:chromosome segregation protein SMC [Halodesulfurarchaeum formicicum]|uniref:Chromosome segregation protein SMC n=1 Tax=Halodesulfurarchaeum formicicum TaxID=1873524 RepID=A0A1D8S262_9EURY|nr:archaea-specific SMC-related protein [Halodesulfurarchaeum formicicum]AOW79421.1 chromosome segregation protein SMC [Halodesulfurarchaeum formicicum]APE94674.1 chromosome segregation protein SMC [Halodesulfurarchaeum formicicum]